MIDLPHIPEDELGRSAVASLRGYAYQVMASAWAWTQLKGDDQLLLEVADDFSICGAGALTLAQVKDTSLSGSVTLRTEGVVEAINRLWRFQKANPDRVIKLEYLTTSSPGYEKQSPFGPGVAGIEFWRVAAFTGDLTALVTFLHSLPLDDDLKAWLATSSEETIRATLLRRIRWSCGQPPLAGLDTLLEESLILIGESYGIPPSFASDVVRNVVLLEALRTAVQPDAKDRALSRSKLLTVIERASSISMPLQELRRGMHKSSDTEVLDRVDVFGPGGLMIARFDSANLVHAALRHGAAWLTGSSGAGKTALARETVRTSNRIWKLLDLRNLDSQATATRLCAARRELSRGDEVGGIILDDLSIQAMLSVRGELQALRTLLSSKDAGLIIAAYWNPPPSLALDLALGPEAVVEAPAFTEKEVATLITAAGGDPIRWARSVHVFGGGGHAQLVAARVAGLKSRGWPYSEIVDGLAQGGPRDVAAEREAVRARLVDELPEKARSLLYRLSLLISNFDRQLALAIGSAHPALSEPGAALDLLIGPWIEIASRGRLRLSPLISGAAEATLSAAEKLATHRAAVGFFLGQSIVDANDLTQILLSAMFCKDGTGLAIIARAVFQAEPEELQYVLYLLPLLRTDQPLFEASARINLMLRVAQLKVASGGTNGELIEVIHSRLLKELEGTEHAKVQRGMAAFMLITAKQARVPPARWLCHLRDFENSLESISTLVGTTVKMDLTDDPGAALFAIRAVNFSSLDDLEELFVALEDIDPERRVRYLSGVTVAVPTRRLMLSQGWLKPSREPDYDARAAEQRYAGFQTIAARWGDVETLVECLRTRAILLSEYAHLPEEALDLLDGVDTSLSSHPSLQRARYKILFQMGRYEEVAAFGEVLLAEMPASDTAERVYLGREVAISASAVGDLTRAIKLFEMASNSAAEWASFDAAAVGLAADRAYAIWRSGDRAEAITVLRDAMLSAEALDAAAEGKASVYRGISVIARAMYQDLINPDWDQDQSTAIFGVASSPSPSATDSIASDDILPAWYQLEAVEKQFNMDLGITNLLLERTKSQKIVLFEFIRFNQAFLKALTSDSPVAIVTGISLFARTASYSRDEQKNGQAELENFSLSERVINLPWEGTFNIDDSVQRRFAETALRVSSAFAISRGDADWPNRLRSQLVSEEGVRQLLDLIPAPGERISPNDSNFGRGIYSCFKVLGLGHPPADDLFVATVRIWDWLGDTILAKELAKALGNVMALKWAFVAEQGRFALRSPAVTGPEILKACQKLEDRSAIAHLILAVQPALNVSIPRSMYLALLGAAGRQS